MKSQLQGHEDAGSCGELRGAARSVGSLVSRVKVFKRPRISVIYPTHPPLVSRSLSEIWSISGSFYHEFHECTNDTNLFQFNIRDIRLFVSFVISKHLISRQHISSTRRLQRELPKSRSVMISWMYNTAADINDISRKYNHRVHRGTQRIDLKTLRSLRPLWLNPVAFTACVGSIRPQQNMREDA